MARWLHQEKMGPVRSFGTYLCFLKKPLQQYFLSQRYSRHPPEACLLGGKTLGERVKADRSAWQHQESMETRPQQGKSGIFFFRLFSVRASFCSLPFPLLCVCVSVLRRSCRLVAQETF